MNPHKDSNIDHDLENPPPHLFNASFRIIYGLSLIDLASIYKTYLFDYVVNRKKIT